jgi:hypothetical protein
MIASNDYFISGQKQSIKNAVNVLKISSKLEGPEHFGEDFLII